MTPEGRVKDGIKKWLRAEGLVGAAEVAKHEGPIDGWFYMPVQSRFSVKGIGDFNGVWRGVPWMIEAKAPGNTPTENQLQQLAAFRAAGGISVVVDSVSQLVSFKQEMEARWTSASWNTRHTSSSCTEKPPSATPRPAPRRSVSPGSTGCTASTATTRSPRPASSSAGADVWTVKR